MLLDHADFALQEQAEDNLMVAFSWAWYNGSFSIAAKPIKSPRIALYNDPVFNNTYYSTHCNTGQIIMVIVICALNIRHLYTADILRYNNVILCAGEKNSRASSKCT